MDLGEKTPDGWEGWLQLQEKKRDLEPGQREGRRTQANPDLTGVFHEVFIYEALFILDMNN